MSAARPPIRRAAWRWLSPQRSNATRSRKRYAPPVTRAARRLPTCRVRCARTSSRKARPMRSIAPMPLFATPSTWTISRPPSLPAARVRPSTRPPPRSSHTSQRFLDAASFALARIAFLGAEFRDVRDQFHGDGLGEPEANRALADLVRCKLAFECPYQAIAGGIKRVVLLPPREIEHRSALQFVGGDLVSDRLFGAGHGVADGVADATQDRLHIFGVRCDVVVHGCEIGLCHYILTKTVPRRPGGKPPARRRYRPN